MGVHRLYSGKQSGSGTKMLKLTLAACVLAVAVEGSYYGSDGYGYGGYGGYGSYGGYGGYAGYGGYGGYGGHGYGGYGGYGYGGYGGYGYSGYGYPSYGGYGGYGYGTGYGYGGYGTGYGYGGYGSGYGSKYHKRSTDHQQVHVSGYAGQPTVVPTNAYGGYSSYAPAYYGGHHASS